MNKGLEIGERDRVGENDARNRPSTVSTDFFSRSVARVECKGDGTGGFSKFQYLRGRTSTLLPRPWKSGRIYGRRRARGPTFRFVKAIAVKREVGDRPKGVEYYATDEFELRFLPRASVAVTVPPPKLSTTLRKSVLRDSSLWK